jgi:hypothetical protein
VFEFLLKDDQDRLRKGDVNHRCRAATVGAFGLSLGLARVDDKRSTLLTFLVAPNISSLIADLLSVDVSKPRDTKDKTDQDQWGIIPCALRAADSITRTALTDFRIDLWITY